MSGDYVLNQALLCLMGLVCGAVIVLSTPAEGLPASEDKVSDPRQRPAGAWLIAPEDKIALCWIPKVGSRGTVALFEKVTGCLQHPVAENWTLCRHQRPPCANTCGGVSPRSVSGASRLPGWHRIAVVRDPMTRFISLYLDKFGVPGPDTSWSRVIRLWDNERILIGGRSWRKVIEDGAEASPDLLANLIKVASDGTVDPRIPDGNHVTQQFDCCPFDPDIRVVRLENLTEALLAFFDDAGASGPWKKIVPTTKVAPEHSTGADSKVCKLATKRTFEVVRKLYANDYDLFNKVNEPFMAWSDCNNGN